MGAHRRERLLRTERSPSISGTIKLTNDPISNYLMLGQTIAGRYYIKKQLGGGGFAVTYLAEDTKNLNRPHRAVKQLKLETTDPKTLEKARELFQREAAILEKLKHDRLPKLLDYFEENGEFFLVQEFIDGRVLSKEITPGKIWTEAQVITLLKDILKTLTFLHQNKIIHRDLKPDNLIRRATDNKIVLIDFGAVSEITTQILDFQTQKQPTVIGTPGYMPPEQQYGRPNLSSDIYALGIIAIQALTGILPEELPIDASSGEIVWRDRVQVSDRLAKILTKMVRSNCRDRFPSATEVLQALFSSSQASPAPHPPPPPLFPLGKILIALIVTVGVGVTAIAMLTGKSDFQTYQNPSAGIKIEYSPDWNLQKIPNKITKEVVEIFSPNYEASLLITVEPLQQFMSLAEYSDEEIESIKQFAVNPNNINIQTDTLAKRSAMRVTYEANESGKIIKRMEVWTLKKQKAYVVTYEAETGVYSNFLPTVETMINSLEIIDN